MKNLYSLIIDGNDICIYKDLELVRSWTYEVTYKSVSFKSLLEIAFTQLYDLYLKDIFE